MSNQETEVQAEGIAEAVKALSVLRNKSAPVILLETQPEVTPEPQIITTINPLSVKTEQLKTICRNFIENNVKNFSPIPVYDNVNVPSVPALIEKDNEEKEKLKKQNVALNQILAHIKNFTDEQTNSFVKRFGNDILNNAEKLAEVADKISPQQKMLVACHNVHVALLKLDNNKTQPSELRLQQAKRAQLKKEITAITTLIPKLSNKAIADMREKKINFTDYTSFKQAVLSHQSLENISPTKQTPAHEVISPTEKMLEACAKLKSFHQNRINSLSEKQEKELVDFTYRINKDKKMVKAINVVERNIKQVPAEEISILQSLAEAKKINIDFNHFPSFSPYFINLREKHTHNKPTISHLHLKEAMNGFRSYIAEYLDQVKKPTTWLNRFKNLSDKRENHVAIANDLINELNIILDKLALHQCHINATNALKTTYIVDGDNHRVNHEYFLYLQKIIAHLDAAYKKLQQETSYLGESKLKQTILHILGIALDLENQAKINRATQTVKSKKSESLVDSQTITPGAPITSTEETPAPGLTEAASSNVNTKEVATAKNSPSLQTPPITIPNKKSTAELDETLRKVLNEYKNTPSATPGRSCRDETGFYRPNTAVLNAPSLSASCPSFISVGNY